MKNTFYMVYVEGERSPVFKHDTLTSAEIEAKRLSRETEKKAYVLCSIKSFEIDLFNTEDLRPDTDLPF